MKRIVIDLYDHTPMTEVADILDALRGIGLDGARYESDRTLDLERIAADLGIDISAETQINRVTSMRADGTVYHHEPR